MLLDFEGGETLNPQNVSYTLKGWSANFNVVQAGRIRGHSLSLPSSASTTKTLPSTYATVFFGFGWNPGTGGTAGSPLVRFFTGTGALIATLDSNGPSQRFRIMNSSSTVIATSTNVAQPNAWQYLELRITVNGASGSCEFHVNGTVDVASTVGNFGTVNIGQVNINGYSGTNTGLYDDMYFCDDSGSAPTNTFLGDIVVETLFPNADGSNLAWTPSAAGSHFNKVNESSGTWPDGDTTYVSDANPGDRDTYTVPPLAIANGTIFGVAVNLYARKDDAGTRQIAPVIKQAGTNYDGTPSAGLSTSYGVVRQIYLTDPTGAPWVISTVNGNEYGVKEVA